jgi:ABC-type uncharacterized transport system YnjBCD substrate-binding protein
MCDLYAGVYFCPVSRRSIAISSRQLRDRLWVQPAWAWLALIPKTARHPNAAKLFLDYLLSREGQRQLALLSLGTVRSDVANPTSEMQQVANLRPIHVGPDLLTCLDQAKRKTFFQGVAAGA